MPSSNKVKKVKKSDKFLPGTEGETIKKVEEAAKLISNGKTRATVIEYLQNEYGIAYDTARKYYNDAIHYLLPDNDEEFRQNLVKVNYERLDKIIQESMNAGNYRVAREAIAEQNKMCGLTGSNVQIGYHQDKDNNTEFIIKLNTGD